MKRKVLMLSLALALVAILALSATLAYFTDTDYAHNTMVIGNIKIDQFEKQIVYDADGAPIGMEDYVDAKGIMPATDIPRYDGVKGEWSELDANNTGAYAGEEFIGWNELWADHMNAQDKFVFVMNTGKNDVYYRTIILYEDPLNPDDHKGCLRPNVSGNERFDWDAVADGAQNGNNVLFYEDIYVDGVRYVASVATYLPTLAPEEISRPSLLQVAMDNESTQEYAALFGDNIDVLCFTQAVQAEGFDDAHTALNAAFGELSSANIQAWIESEELTLVP